MTTNTRFTQILWMRFCGSLLLLLILCPPSSGQGLGPKDNSSTPSTSSGGGSIFGGDPSDGDEPGENQGPPCVGLNICLFGSPCSNNGTCFYDSSFCTVHCICPPPYNDSRFYDNECRARATPITSTSTPASSTLSPSSSPLSSPSSSPSLLSSSPSPSSPSSFPTIPSVSPTPSTTLRPLSERDCSGVGRYDCQHGVCNATRTEMGLQYDCYCDPGWRGMLFCDTPCTRNCSNNGTCGYYRDNQTEFCQCPRPWVGPYCTDLIPEEDNDWVYWLAGCLAAGFVIIVVLAAVFMFYLWRKRLVFALKFVYYFLPYEDKDGRKYDAFVSYVARDEDEMFVCRTLTPKLEREMGFKLCLHQRDILAGEVISNSIIKALDDSRRFILVLSPRYLQNEWTEFEFYRAFHEMLKKKMRIIPVILEDIDHCDSLNPTLRVILDSVTHISFPGSEADEQKLSKFWKKVQLSMPKRKRSEDMEMYDEIGQTRL